MIAMKGTNLLLGIFFEQLRILFNLWLKAAQLR